MPWHVAKSDSCPTSKPWAVIKDADGKVVGCHPSKVAANKQLAALYAAEGKEGAMDNAPRDDLIRAMPARFELERTDNGDGMPTMRGHFARFNEWTEIDSWFEGRFMERLAKGSFRKTIDENRDSMKVLFEHGSDFNIGNKVLGPIDELREDSKGVFYEVPLLDTSYNRDLLPGLEAGLYGASFRFKIVKEKWNDEPGQSDTNPDGLKERTIQEVRLFEFGPVTFPAYAGATAGVRSLTDHFLDRLLANPKVAERLQLRTPNPAADGAAEGTPSGNGAATPSEEPRKHSIASQARERVLLLEGIIE